MPQGGALSDGRLVHFPLAGSSWNKAQTIVARSTTGRRLICRKRTQRSQRRTNFIAVFVFVIFAFFRGEISTYVFRLNVHIDECPHMWYILKPNEESDHH